MTTRNDKQYGRPNDRWIDPGSAILPSFTQSPLPGLQYGLYSAFRGTCRVNTIGYKYRLGATQKDSCLGALRYCKRCISQTPCEDVS
jgi:hypothetical protein